MEIERKFLVNDNINKLDLNKYEKREISQYYLALDPEIRVRKSNNKCYLTVKSKGGLIRNENEREVSLEFYEHFKCHAFGNIVIKTRYVIPINDKLNIELDIYHDFLNGLKVAEIEFESKKQAEDFKDYPSYFEKEVTDVLNYKNVYLATKKVSN